MLRLLARTPTERLHSPSLRLWRVSTAVRVFVLALAAGTMLGADTFGVGLPLLAALALIAMVGAALEWDSTAPGVPWVPVGEVSLAAILLASAPAQAGLLVYLAAPPLVAGIRHGVVATINAALVGGLVLSITFAVSSQPYSREQVISSLLWLVTGLGLGLLASWQSRAARELEERQAPHASVHNLMAQLHGLTRSGHVDLDSQLLAEQLGAHLRAKTNAHSSAVFVRGQHTLQLVSAHGEHASLVDAVRQEWQHTPPGMLVLPLRGHGEVLGQVALDRADPWTDQETKVVQDVLDEQALPLSTAFLFEGVRSMATAEERTRIAREMHDGVAQEVVALGYVVDEIESTSTESDIQQLAGSLRHELSRVVTELRLSIFDLRQDVSDHLSGALAECVRVNFDNTGIAAHLALQESGRALPSRVQVELLRVAQEAIGNVRRHARAQNLWVTLVSNGTDVTLEVVDDGVGSARPRERHWGLQTMHERAQAIGAQLTVTDRSPSGTHVRLQTVPSPRREEAP
jgi:signal transduction histidine kinase